MAISDDCRRLARNLAQQLDLALHALLAPLIARIGRNKVDRLMVNHDSPENEQKKLIWRPECIELLADITAASTVFKAADVLAHLLDPQAPVDPDLRALVRREEYHLHTSATQRAVDDRIRALAHRAKTVVSCEGPLRLDLNSDEVIANQVENEKLFWGLSEPRAQYRKACANGAQSNVWKDYEAAQSVIVGQRASYYDDLIACRGLHKGLHPDHAIESISDFACEYVKELGVDYRCIDEGKWPDDLRQWAQNYERIIAFDERILIYVQAAGRDRTILVKTGDASRDALFYQELARLYQAVEPRFLRHEQNRRAVLEMMDVDTDAMDRRRRQIVEENARLMRESSPVEEYPDRPAHRVWLPRH
jgi:hypothetical protein